MTSTTYLVTLTDGQQFRMSANLAEASAPIQVSFPDQDDDGPVWQGTPFQTADARHSDHAAAALCAEYFSAGDEDCTDVRSVEAADGE